MSPNYTRDGRAPIPNDENVSKVMSSIRAKNTKPEITLRKALYNQGHSGYRIHWAKAPGRPDIAYPGRKIAIFVNGCFWHRCPHCNPPMPKTHVDFWKTKFAKNVERDQIKINDLVNMGWRVFTFWECEICKNVDECVKQIEILLK